MTDKEICADLQIKLKPSRYEHSMGVAYTAACLAMRYGADSCKAFRAGILHDCGKYLDGEASIRFCEDNGIPMTESEVMKPGALLHAKTGAYIASNEYGEEDREIIDAILTHTVGDVDMSILQKIIFVSDYIEPNRRMLPRMEEIRNLAFSDIDKCIVAIYESTFSYLESNPDLGAVDDRSRTAYEYYRKLVED